MEDDAAPEEDTVGRVADAALEETASESEMEVLGIDKVVVSRPPPTGGIEIGWPAMEHCRTTSLDTAGKILVQSITQGNELAPTRLVGNVACFLDTGGYGGRKIWLLAMTSKVCQL